MVIDLEQALRVYLIADPAFAEHDLIDRSREALAGGVTMIQLRAKSLSDREAFELGMALRDECAIHGAAFLVNDRIDIALALKADGVHLGVDDFPLEAARALSGPEFVIGFSPETDHQAANAKARGASYLGVGPVYGTTSKPDAGPSIGLEKIALRTKLGGIPAIGIGGVTDMNAGSVIQAGAWGVAVISAILCAGDPRAAATNLRKAVDAALADG
jgi:thiamine-phosphate pyrophosphorylase